LEMFLQFLSIFFCLWSHKKIPCSVITSSYIILFYCNPSETLKISSHSDNFREKWFLNWALCDTEVHLVSANQIKIVSIYFSVYLPIPGLLQPITQSQDETVLFYALYAEIS
jgi:hypothetical protein